MQTDNITSCPPSFGIWIKFVYVTTVCWGLCSKGSGNSTLSFKVLLISSLKVSPLPCASFSRSGSTLSATFQFQGDYESYIKHYPLTEQRHRTELKYNKHYQEFMQECSQDPRVQKRDLITFLSRPVTRLPRLNLILQHLHKLTDANHPDSEDLPVILSVLNDFLKSTQPGIEAAENKVKFWDLRESLIFSKEEIIVMYFLLALSSVLILYFRKWTGIAIPAHSFMPVHWFASRNLKWIGTPGLTFM